MIEGFEYTDVEVGPTTYRPGVAGHGPPVLLLHGFPETHYCWHRLAPGLAEEHAVVVCDLKGYGETARRRAGRSERAIRTASAPPSWSS